MLDQQTTALNGICPYFTMFPLQFPYGILKRNARKGDTVLDPFCGRGTTNYAAALMGLSSYGIDSSPVAAAIAAAKLVYADPDAIMSVVRKFLNEVVPQQLPNGEFWNWAYHSNVLYKLCQLREGLLSSYSSDASIALRAIILGALHGPRQKVVPGYFSNQCPRTFAPKPRYSVKFWQERNLHADDVDICAVIKHRARRYYSHMRTGIGFIRCADSRYVESYHHGAAYKWIITSPPYYGMRTYVQDQWLRYWFLGGPDYVDYSVNCQIQHSGPDMYIDELKRVWNNTSLVSDEQAKLIIRFGGIPDRKANPLDLIKSSLVGTRWKISTIRRAGTASEGRRQANSFLKDKTTPLVEYDIWARHSD